MENEAEDNRIGINVDDNDRLLVENERSKLKDHLREFVACAIVCLGSFSMGNCIGYSSPAVSDMQKRPDSILNGLTNDQASWIGSLLTVGAMVGSVVAGPLAEKLGRHIPLILSIIPALFGWICIVSARNVLMVYIGRVVTGFCIGMISLFIPVYIAETASPQFRGLMGAAHQFGITMGILYVYAFGVFAPWEWITVACMLTLFLLAVLLPAIPESPRWLLLKGHEMEAVQALKWFRGKNTDINGELHIIEENIQKVLAAGKITLREFASPSLWKPLVICIFLMIFQQFCGVNAVMFYTTKIFNAIHLELDPNVQTVIIGAVGVLGTVIAVGVIEATGRKILLVTSGFMMAIAMAAIGAYFYILEKDPSRATGIGWLPLVGLVVFNLGFSVGMGPIPWVLMPELFPLKARGFVGSIVVGLNWMFAFIVTKTFMDLQNAIGVGETYWMFMGFSIVSVVFVILFIPETKGKTLEEIEEYFLT